MQKVTRRGFLGLCGVLGAGPLIGCGSSGEADLSGTRVAILGAGAAGLSAGHLLAQRGADFEIFEAAPTYGGRMKSLSGFVNFPIPLGAEWLHEPEDELSRIVGDPSVAVTTRLQPYASSDPTDFYDGELTRENLGALSDLKFVGATWLDFFETYIVPSVASQIRLNTAIARVDYSGPQAVLTDTAGATYEADRVIVTVPLQVLRDGDLEFLPELPRDKRDAIADARIWGGLKVFLEFREAFYPTFLSFDGRDGADGQHVYYDASYGQESSSNVLGLFTVGVESERYRLASSDAVRDLILAELDEVYDGAATRAYLAHVVQDWNAEPFIGQAYLADSAALSTPRRLFAPVDDRLYFAGEAYTNHDDWGAVDDAARAARAVVERLTPAR
ncbi:MAG: FAD-dependent oxidoreductase [Myxococcota bacterium]